MKFNPFESRRRLAEREDRRYRGMKSTAFFNGCIVAILGLLSALTCAVKDESVGIFERLTFVLSYLGITMLGLWSVRFSYTLTHEQRVRTSWPRLDAEIAEEFLKMGQIEENRKIPDGE